MLEFKPEISSETMQFAVDRTNEIQAELFKQGDHWCAWAYGIYAPRTTHFKSKENTKKAATEQLQGWIDDHYLGDEFFIDGK